MTNLFALVSTDPKVVASHEDPLGDNDRHLRVISLMADEVMFVWGNFKGFNARIEHVRSIISSNEHHNPMCLGKNKNGTPKHPCRLAYNTAIVPFR